MTGIWSGPLAMRVCSGGRTDYVCRTPGADKTGRHRKQIPGRCLPPSRSLLDRLQHHVPPGDFRHGSCEPVVLAGESEKLPGRQKTGFLGFSEALEAFYPMTKAEKAQVTSKPKLSEEERIHRYKETAIKKLRENRKGRRIVAAIYENYPFIAQVISSLDAASKRLSWQEMSTTSAIRNSRCKTDRGLPSR